MERLRSAVIGLGRMGAGPSSRLEGIVPEGWLPIGHLECVLNSAQFEVAAICDIDEEKVAALADANQIEGKYTDGMTLIHEVKPEFLSIATRTEGRVELIEQAIEAGAKILYFEKPISRSVEACRKVLSKASEAGVICGYGVNRRYHYAYRQVQQRIREGEFGPVQQINIEHGYSNLYWSHPHSVDLILFFAGTTSLTQIQGKCTFINDYKVSDPLFIDNDPLVDHAYFEFSNGVTATINQGIGLNTRIVCEKAIITIYSDGAWVEVQRIKESGYLMESERISLEPTEESATEYAFKALHHAHLHKTDSPISLEEITTGLIMLNGLVYSTLRQGAAIGPEEVPEEMVVTGRSGNYYA